MSKNLGIAVVVMALVALIVSGISLGMTFANKPQEQAAPTTAANTASNPTTDTAADIQYVMYVGTNDKDTNQPVYTPDECKNRADVILTNHFDGFTIQEAQGGWAYEGTIYHEYTLVVYLSDTNIDAIHAAADDFIKEFNQSSILIQANETKTEFYSTGNEK